MTVLLRAEEIVTGAIFVWIIHYSIIHITMSVFFLPQAEFKVIIHVGGGLLCTYFGEGLDVFCSQVF